MAKASTEKEKQKETGKKKSFRLNDVSNVGHRKSPNRKFNVSGKLAPTKKKENEDTEVDNYIRLPKTRMSKFNPLFKSSNGSSFQKLNNIDCRCEKKKIFDGYKYVERTFIAPDCPVEGHRMFGIYRDCDKRNKEQPI